MEKLKIALAMTVVFLITLYNVLLMIRRRNKKDSKIYCVTLCTAGEEGPLVVRGGSKQELTETGTAVEQVITRLGRASNKVEVRGCFIEPNRVNLLLAFPSAHDELLEPFKVNLKSVIKIFCKATAKKIGRNIWRSDMQSRRIKDDDEYEKIKKGLENVCEH